jgi:O-antigen ligase
MTRETPGSEFSPRASSIVICGSRCPSLTLPARRFAPTGNSETLKLWNSLQKVGRLLKLGLMLALTLTGTVGGVIYTPFVPVLVYYFFAVLRPQFLWKDSLSTYVPDDFPWSLIVALAAIGTTILARGGMALAPHRFRHVAVPRFHFVHACFGLFAFWITLTYYNAENMVAADAWYPDYRKIFLMFFVASLAITTIRQLWTMYLLMTLALMYIAWEINEIYLTSGGYNYLYKRGYCGLDNNGAALMLAMGLPFCIFAWDRIRHPVRWVFLIGAAMIGHCILLSYSRGAMLSVIATAPLYLFRCQSKKAILTLYLIGLAALPILAGEEIQKRFFSIGEHKSDESAQSRMTTWGIAWRMAQERPLLGYGIRNSSLYTYKFGADEEGRVIHSTWLQIAADSGIAGLGCYALMLASAFACLALIRRRIAGHIPLLTYAIATGNFLTGGGWSLPKQEHGRDDPDAQNAYAMAGGIEVALLTFCFGCTFLSLETFEPPYMIVMMAAQIFAVLKITSPSPPSMPADGDPETELPAP